MTKRIFTGWLAALYLVLCTASIAGAQDHSAAAPKEITVGMYINDIQAIDMRTNSYGVDFYLWFRWQDPETNPAEGFELMNTFDPEAHVETVIYDEPKVQPDGSLYQIIRHQGLFSSKFPVGKYPFDSQILLVSVEDAEEGADSYVYVPDTDGLKLNPEIVLPGYDIGKPRLNIRSKPYPTTFGDLAEPDVSSYSRAEFIVPITRPAVSGVFKAFVPVFLIILSAAFALLLDPVHVEARIGLAITALLSLVAMQFTMLSSMPEVAYLTLLDQLYLISYLYILVVIAFIVYATRIDEQGAIQGKKGNLAKITASGPPTAILVTGIYTVAVGLITALNLMGS
jgi:hypothetical protein